MEEIFTIQALSALLTLTGLEIILGIDNIVFLAILVDKLDDRFKDKARLVGLMLVMLLRILLLFLISWLMLLTEPLFSLMGNSFSGKDLILLAGGLFLLWKATYEIHDSIGNKQDEQHIVAKSSFLAVVSQIALIDLVFSIDSVVTAVGMAKDLWIMIAAIVLAVIIMLLFARTISAFIEKYPTLKILALAFLLLVGVMLIADGLGKHINRGYLYFAMAFSLFVEMINIKVRQKELS